MTLKEFEQLMEAEEMKIRAKLPNREHVFKFILINRGLRVEIDGRLSTDAVTHLVLAMARLEDEIKKIQD